MTSNKNLFVKFDKVEETKDAQINQLAKLKQMAAPATTPASKPNYFSNLTSMRKEEPKTEIKPSKDMLKKQLESLLQTELPQSPYFTSYQEASQSTNTQTSPNMVLRGSRSKYWQNQVLN